MLACLPGHGCGCVVLAGLLLLSWIIYALPRLRAHLALMKKIKAHATNCGAGALVEVCLHQRARFETLLTLSGNNGGRTMHFSCACRPRADTVAGMGVGNVYRHLASRGHFNHRRLVVFGERQPNQAA